MSKSITIDGIEYVPKEEINVNSKDMVIVRTYSAGVHYGELVSHEGKNVTLRRSRRLYKWSGANTLSELATNGVNNPKDCKFCVRVDIKLTEAIEVITCTQKAVDIIEAVSEWTHE